MLRTSSLVLLCSGAALVSLVSSCSSDEAVAPADPEFVGRATCAGCHQPEHDRWLGSHHDLAMQEADAQSVLGDFDDATFDYNGVTTRFWTRDGQFVVTTDGPDGELHDYEVRYAFGVTPLQQYLVAIDGGRLQALLHAWDSRPAEAGGQRWFHLRPDEAIDHRDELHWTGRTMNWNFMCATCHSTEVRRNHDLTTDSYATTWIEIDVSCEACHGAGSAHVAWAERGATTSDPTRGLAVQLPGPGQWVLSPGEAIATRTEPLIGHVEVDTCAPCHSRRSQIREEPWHGRPFGDSYLPSLLEDRLYQADGQILDEVYVWGSFTQSKMHGAGVTCSDCHDPHSARLIASGNALCARCHATNVYDVPTHHHHEQGTDGASCVACHMRAKTYMVVDPRRDHSFRVPRPDLTAAIGTPNACQDCHADAGAVWAANAVREWRGDAPAPADGFARALHDARRGKPGAMAALVTAASDSSLPGIARATALASMRDAPGERDLDTLRTAAADPDPLVRRGVAEALDGLTAEQRASIGVSLLGDPTRMVRVQAGRAMANDTVPPDAREQRDRALQEWMDFQRTNADQPWAHLNLGVLAAERGDTSTAERAYREALSLDPDSIQARVNLADLWRRENRDDRGEALLREGLARQPGSPELRHALGLLLVRTERREGAIGELEAAARDRPENPRFAYVAAVALSSTGQRPRAIELLEGALSRNPWDAELLFGLASFLRDAGETARAIETAERLVRVAPDAQPLLEELRRGR